MRLHRAILPALTLLLAACASTMQVESVVAPDAAPPHAGQTYAWRGGSGGVYGDIRMTRNQALDQVIRSIIDEELTARGFTRVEGDAELGLAYVAAVERELEVEEVNEYLRYRRSLWLSTYTEVREYDRGSLVLDFTTPDGDLLWRGAARAELHSDDRGYRASKLREGVATLLDELAAARGES